MSTVASEPDSKSHEAPKIGALPTACLGASCRVEAKYRLPAATFVGRSRYAINIRARALPASRNRGKFKNP